MMSRLGEMRYGLQKAGSSVRPVSGPFAKLHRLVPLTPLARGLRRSSNADWHGDELAAGLHASGRLGLPTATHAVPRYQLRVMLLCKAFAFGSTCCTSISAHMLMASDSGGEEWMVS